jgi:opacity protein-like surface antigen
MPIFGRIQPRTMTVPILATAALLRPAHLLFSIIAVAMIALTATARADEWHTSGVLYMQGANMDGYTVVDGQRTDVDVSASQLFDHLDIAGMMALRSESERQALTLNAQYSGLSADASGAAGAFYDLDVTQEMVELAWSWRLNERHELYVGARYQSLSVDLSIRQADGTSSAAQQARSLFDPVVGARGAWPLGQKWTLIARADIGGFGVDSDLTWSTLAVADWSLSPNFGLVFGYRALDTDYSQGSGDRRFEFDMRVSGPLIGLRYDFGT